MLQAHVLWRWSALFLALAGCERARSEPRIPLTEANQAPRSSNRFPAGVIAREVTHEGGVWDIFELDLQRIELRLYGQSEPALRRFAKVRARLEAEGKPWGPLTNGGMFHV